MRRRPQFVPILTSYAQRVSGLTHVELMRSSATMARALADTHKLIGCDAVLCFWDPSLLPRACATRDQLGDVDDPISAPEFQFLLDTARALRAQLPNSMQVFATFAGPSLLSSQVVHFEDDYAQDVVLAAVRAALEAGTQGVALIESGSADVIQAHRVIRKLADFYDAAFFAYQLPPMAAPTTEADCVFCLPDCDRLQAVVGVVKSGAAPVTTSCDVPPETPVEFVRALLGGVVKWSQQC